MKLLSATRSERTHALRASSPLVDESYERAAYGGGYGRYGIRGPWSPLGTHPRVTAACNLADTRIRDTKLVFENADGEMAPRPSWARDMWLADFISESVKSLWLHGNLFGTPLRDRSGRVGEIEMIDPCRVSTELTTLLGKRTEWRYLVDGKPVSMMDELVHVKFSSVPGTPLGIGAVSASAAGVEMGVGADRYLVAHMRNGPKIATLLKPDRPMGPKRAKDLKEAFAASTTTPEVAWRPIVVSGVEVTQIAYSMADGQFMELATWNDQRIAGAFNMDPSVLGIPSSSGGGGTMTYQNIQQRDLLLWSDSLAGLASRMSLFLSEFMAAGRQARFDGSQWRLGGLSNRAQVGQHLALINKHEGRPVVAADEIREVLSLAPAMHDMEPSASAAGE